MRSDIKQDLIEKDEDPEFIPMTQTEAVARVREDIAVADDLESQFNEWNKVQNPLAKLEQDMKVRECTKMSILTYRRVASRYMRRHNWDPQVHQG
jgi:hypothetical protein